MLRIFRRTGRVAAFLLCWLGVASVALAQNSSINQNRTTSDPYSSNQNNSDSRSSSENSITSSDNPYAGQQILQPYDVTGKDSSSPLTLEELLTGDKAEKPENVLSKQPPKPGEFENYVERLLGRKLPRYGTDLVLPALRDFAAPATATVPPDYIVQPGDMIIISMSGSMEGSVEREVKNDGTIFLSGVGTVKVAGARHSDLQGVLARAIGTQFRGFTVSVNIKKLRGIRVYVTGLANNPGAFTVSSLSTLANAVFQAGGPSSGGSWRSIKLYRNGQQVADFDLYQLMRGGSRVNDIQLQNEDVLFIPPAGEQVAVIGSVQEEAIYEAKPGESIADMLAAAGGPNTLADRSRVIVYHTGDQDIPGPKQIDFAQAGSTAIQGGDIIQMLSSGTLAMPIARQSVLVRIEGEVNKPGIYYVAPNTPTSQVIAMAGGLTSSANAYGTRFTRQSVKIQQQKSFREAVDQLELTLAAAPLTADSSLTEEQRTSQVAGAKAFLERLRKAEPDGRIVLPISPDSQALPGDIMLENNDLIYIPPKSTTIGVFGAVYHPASFFVSDGTPGKLKVSDYVEKAGGMLRSGDRSNIFLVRANGDVVSRKRGALHTQVMPGDVVFVPVKTQGSTFWAKVKDITQTLFQIGVTAATIVAVTK